MLDFPTRPSPQPSGSEVRVDEVWMWGRAEGEKLSFGAQKPKGLYAIAFYILTMATTIQVSNKLVESLRTRKMYDKESYEDIIWDLLEDTMELSEETKRHIKESRKDIKAGRVYSHEQIKKKLGL